MSAPITINGRAAVRREVGGVERVARELIRHLPRVNPERYRVISPPQALAHGPGQPWEQLWLPVLARGSSVLLSPANLSPLWGPPSVVMIYDVAPLVGDWYSPAYSRWHRLMLPRVARRARLVITASEAVRAQVSDRLGVPIDRVAAVPLGVDERFSAPADADAVRRRHGIGDRPYVLALGTDTPRKNLSLMDRIGPVLAEAGFDTVLAGSGRPYMPGGDYRSRAIGYVEEADLPGLYQGAAALAMPSLYEGFGLPCLEAMAAGTPVVCSDRGALPETCGDAAIVADPDDEAGFAAAVLTRGGARPRAGGARGPRRPARGPVHMGGNREARRCPARAAARALAAAPALVLRTPLHPLRDPPEGVQRGLGLEAEGARACSSPAKSKWLGCFFLV